MIMKSKGKERNKIYNIYDKRKAECFQFSIQQKEVTQCTCCILNLHS